METVSDVLPCVITMLSVDDTNEDWPRSVHETGHVLCALLLGDHVDGATLRHDHPMYHGMTWTTAVPWHAVMIDRAGRIAEELVLAPEVFAARAARAVPPWAFDFVAAEEHALLFAGSCDNMKDARRLAPPAGQEAALEAAVEAQPKSFAPEVIAAYEQREAAQMPRRKARAQRLIAHADEVVHRMLAKNVIVLRVIADRLAKIHTVGSDELLQLFETGLAAQLEDDAHMARAAGTRAGETPRTPQASPSDDDAAPGARQEADE
jgi:hypothetical protein